MCEELNLEYKHHKWWNEISKEEKEKMIKFLYDNPLDIDFENLYNEE